MSTWRGNALSGLVHATPTSTNFVSWYRKSTQVDPACHLSEMVVGLGKVYEVIKRVPVVPDVPESNHALQAPLRQDSGGDACVVPALKCKFFQDSEIAKFVTTILFLVLVNNIRSLTLRKGPEMSRTERQTQGHRWHWSFPAKAIRV
uniref:(northern house mosquito) hypothetical protein n=1 Tax=Culex pipiens TaxID=7175 RepID=A0A8D8AXC3_CULPI